VLLTGLTFKFLREGLWLTFPMLLTLGLLITFVGQVVGRKEGWSRFDSSYWAFVTGTTVGYGDLRPQQKASRLLSILVALLGLTFTGILIAVAVRAATVALASHDAAAAYRH
jgi:hypothetical protein